jgi:serine/threonine protein kinase
MFRASAIGSGSYGQVVRVYDGDSGDEYAGKIFDSGDEYVFQIASETLWEIAMLKKISHPNIIRVEKVVASVDHHTDICMCMKIYPICLDIFVESITKNETMQVAAGLLSALRCLQLHCLVHRDIKPENVLLTNDIDPILIDFSFVTPVDRCIASPINISGTPTYCSVESRVANYNPSFELDWYALGVLLFECCQKARLQFDRDKSAIKYLQDQRAKMTDKHAMARVIKSLLDPDPAGRMQPLAASSELGYTLIPSRIDAPLELTRPSQTVDRSIKSLTKSALRECTWTLAQNIFERCRSPRLSLYLASKIFEEEAEEEPVDEACELDFLLSIDFRVFDV